MITGRVRGSSAGSQVHTWTQTLQPPPTLYQPTAKGSRLSLPAPWMSARRPVLVGTCLEHVGASQEAWNPPP